MMGSCIRRFYVVIDGSMPLKFVYTLMEREKQYRRARHIHDTELVRFSVEKFPYPAMLIRCETPSLIYDFFHVSRFGYGIYQNVILMIILRWSWWLRFLPPQ